jgi:hypothetical protein
MICMVLAQDTLPITAQLLINYDLPATKEIHLRRITCMLGSGDSSPWRTAIIHFVVAGQMAQFRSLEKFANTPIHEMPVHAADVLL